MIQFIVDGGLYFACTLKSNNSIPQKCGSKTLKKSRAKMKYIKGEPDSTVIESSSVWENI